jgi:plastocyanin
LVVAAVLAAGLVGVAVYQAVKPEGQVERSPRASVQAKGRSFAPAVLRVPVGGVAVFRNDSASTHTFTADGGLFDSGRVLPGRSWSVPIGAAGVITYHCEIHPVMTGRIEVG